MRMFLISTVIFMLGCGEKSPKQRIDSVHLSNVNSKLRKLFGTSDSTFIQGFSRYTIVDENKNSDTINLIHHHDSFALVFIKDTIWNSMFDVNTLENYQDTIDIFKYPVRIYSEKKISLLLNKSDKILRRYQWLFLTNLYESENWKDREMAKCPQKLFTADIFPIQLDEDKETERIIELQQHLTSRYFIFDKQEDGWKILDVITLHDGMFRPINCTLTGYFGLESHNWACGLSETTMSYFKVTKDSVAVVFSGDKYLELAYTGSINDNYQIQTSCTGTFDLMSPDTLRATYTINTNAIDTALLEYPLLSNEKLVIYYLKDGIEFRTHANEPWFAPENLDFFIPENYARFRLSEIKNTGTKKQRMILKKYVYQKPDSLWEYR